LKVIELQQKEKREALQRKLTGELIMVRMLQDVDPSSHKIYFAVNNVENKNIEIRSFDPSEIEKNQI
jgi:hypothetical protein